MNSPLSVIHLHMYTLHLNSSELVWGSVYCFTTWLHLLHLNFVWLFLDFSVPSLHRGAPILLVGKYCQRGSISCPQGVYQAHILARKTWTVFQKSLLLHCSAQLHMIAAVLIRASLKLQPNSLLHYVTPPHQDKMPHKYNFKRVYLKLCADTLLHFKLLQ